MDKVRVGVVGVGKMGRYHVRTYSSLKHICELVGVYDINHNRARQVAGEFGTRSFPDLDSLLERVDAITIATPTSTHAEVALAVVERNRHVLVEKPITNQVMEAQRLMREARRRELILQVGHIERFNPAIQELPRVLKDHEIISISVERLSPFDPRIDDTDVIQDLMIHDLDIIRSLGGSQIRDMKAVGRRVNSGEHIDYAVTILTFQNGIIADLTASRITARKMRQLYISTSDSFIELDYLNRRLTVSHRSAHQSSVPPYDEEQTIERVYIPQEDALTAQLKHFLNCVRHDTRPLINGQDGIEALRLTKTIQSKIYTSSPAAAAGVEAVSGEGR